MSFEEVMKEIKSGLSGNIAVDMKYLREQGIKYSTHKDAKKIADAIGELTLELVSNKDNLGEDEIKRINAIINNKYEEASKLVNEENFKEAKKLLEEAIELIPNNEQGGMTHFSFASALELWLFVMMFNPQVKIVQTETDNSSIYNLYGFIQVHSLEIDNAISALESSLKWNPVNVGSLFELAEINRLRGKDDVYFNVIRNALRVSLSRLDLARCYYSLAHYFSDKQDYDTALCLYFVSNAYKESNDVIREIAKLHVDKGTKLEPPTVEETKEVFKEKNIQLGASEYAINATILLAKEAKKNNTLQIFKFCREVYKDLTDKELEI